MSPINLHSRRQLEPMRVGVRFARYADLPKLSVPQEVPVSSTLRSLSGAAVTAAVMYWLDPSSGRRRRARFRDRLGSAARDMRAAVGVGSRDLAHRLRGAAARTRSLFDADVVDDPTLVERVRTCLGRTVAHPGALEVSAVEGRVILRGPILVQEYLQLMRAVAAVRGAREVVDQLDVYADSTGVPALQGGRPRRPPRFNLMRERWSPATRLLTGVTGSALLVLGLRNRGALGLLSAVTGGTLLARTASNMPLAQWVGVTGGNVIPVHKTLRVNAPVDQVFQLMARYENFPLFMRNVRHVRAHPDGRSHWIVGGPAGVSVEWDAMTTRREPNRLLAWRTVSNAAVRHAGNIRFEPKNGGTRLEIQLSYQPPAGALGHVVARLFGADPKTELDEDLLRLKSFLESGKLPRDAATRVPPEYIPTAEAASPNSDQPLH
jgi:uncharacterized membrane protein